MFFHQNFKLRPNCNFSLVTLEIQKFPFRYRIKKATEYQSWKATQQQFQFEAAISALKNASWGDMSVDWEIALAALQETNWSGPEEKLPSEEDWFKTLEALHGANWGLTNNLLPIFF